MSCVLGSASSAASVSASSGVTVSAWPSARAGSSDSGDGIACRISPTRTWRPRTERRGYTRCVRFAVRQAKLDDAEDIARAHTASWRTSYRGILPDAVLDRIDVDQRASSWRRTLQDRSVLT